MRLYDTHPRTLEAKARCKDYGSCHDCAMTCDYGNTVHDEHGAVVPCGTEVFDEDGKIKLCGECRKDAAFFDLADKYITDADALTEEL